MSKEFRKYLERIHSLAAEQLSFGFDWRLKEIEKAAQKALDLTRKTFFVEPQSRHRCANCQCEWTGQDLEPIRDINERVLPGGVVPSGECPLCNCICFPLERFPCRAELVFALRQLLEGCGQFLNFWCPPCGIRGMSKAEEVLRQFDQGLQQDFVQKPLNEPYSVWARFKPRKERPKRRKKNPLELDLFECPIESASSHLDGSSVARRSRQILQ